MPQTDLERVQEIRERIGITHASQQAKDCETACDIADKALRDLAHERETCTRWCKDAMAGGEEVMRLQAQVAELERENAALDDEAQTYFNRYYDLWFRYDRLRRIESAARNLAYSHYTPESYERLLDTLRKELKAKVDNTA